MSNPLKGRGALSNPANRFAPSHSDIDPVEDGEMPVRIATVQINERPKTIISRNQSPDVPFEQSINPYRGCEHGCIYCFARPSHAYWDLSPGLDFETHIIVKEGAAERLELELRARNYRCRPITLGANTDPYQPLEQHRRITRGLLEVLARFRHPFTIITKGALISRDLDILGPMAEQGLCSVMVSMTTLDPQLKRTLEPRAAGPQTRLSAIGALTGAGVPVGVLLAPLIPMINDRELEAMLEASAKAGAGSAGYVFIRLPLEVADLFREWLDCHYPERAEHVMSLIQQSRNGAAYDSRFGTRMRGQGLFAEMIAQRFRLACNKFGLRADRRSALRTDLFSVPPQAGDQLSLL
ncbi:PA0069 family radical SAM protein [Marinobacterium sedimentorum]|uniref:PA0069 family radical SAM protein n=1 Tax=Marinobacterium sedimentorum TaxID=2927804 RepID=UPI0020C667AC|nr:PA0069 family radical SAM protein [Marinobacterium sedimentorum]MCP8687473.1 PA0069 family radical SAM protein [Marinobacterium sedimentorum]